MTTFQTSVLETIMEAFCCSLSPKVKHCCLVCPFQENKLVINNFSSHKAHGYDGISVSMLKICAAEIAIPLQIIFLYCINSGIFPDCWKFANVQPIYKKINRQMKNNYLVVTHWWKNFRKNCL